MAKSTKRSGSGLVLEEVKDVLTGLDPTLQEYVLRARSGERVESSVGTLSDDGRVYVDVIAKLARPDEEIPGLNIVSRMGAIVTGWMALDDVESVRGHDNVLSLKAATRLKSELAFSVSEMHGDQQSIRRTLPADTLPADGSGVIVGVVDYGCDFMHGNFLDPRGGSRLLYLWDQRSGRTSRSPQPYGYGREFSRADIDAALQQNREHPYQELAYSPGEASHGTHVLDIAAGNGEATGDPGVAPNADLIFVQVGFQDFEDDESFGNSRNLLEAVDYIFRKADELGKQAVVNLSLGTHGGPHDGSTLAEQGFDALLEREGRAIVVAAGNSWERASHAMGSLKKGESRTLTWRIGQGDATDNEMEVWYRGRRTLHVWLITPSGVELGPVKPGRTVNLLQDDRRVGRIIHRRQDPNNRDNQIDIILDPSLETGEWGVRLQGVSAAEVEFHAWIERDDRGQSRFARRDDERSYTLGSISCGARTIAVGSYDAKVPGRALSHFTSEGPTRDGKQKPELSAPGHSIRAARSRSQGVTAKSGTSMAAPHVSGLIALLMSAAQQPLSLERIRELLDAGVRGMDAEGWHGRYGNGRVDALSSLMSLAGISRRPFMDARESGRETTGRELPGLETLAALLSTAAKSHGTRIRLNLEVEPLEPPARMGTGNPATSGNPPP